MRVAGLMSGTSLDGIDVAIIDINESDDWRLVAFHDVPLEPTQRKQIHDMIVEGSAQSICRLHAEFGEWLAAAVLDACKVKNIPLASLELIGSHGQTIWHEPPHEGRRGATLQIGDAATIAERTGVAVVSDFRTRDMAAGGEGAPLVPWVDRFLFAQAGRARVLQNIGGIANLTWVPPQGSAEPLLAFDTGPGNVLMNSAVELASRGAEHYDRDGERARRGRVNEALLEELLAHPYFRREPPKSTGRELFGKPFVESLIRQQPGLADDWDSVIATLTALTARTITDSIERWVAPKGIDEVVITGGGARNPALVEAIAQQLAPIPVSDGAVLGVDADAKEAVAFAVLAWAHVVGRPANEPAATGARGPRILGSLTPGAREHESTGAREQSRSGS